MDFIAFLASEKLKTISLFGCKIFKSFINLANLSLSSHKSIDLKDVPKILIPDSTNFSDNFSGVWPPS